MSSNDGGPAFPRLIRYPNSHLENEDGMSLRDYFAGQALASLAHRQSDGEPMATAIHAYQVANAMLKAREGMR
jgi:hypothetical protein